MPRSSRACCWACSVGTLAPRLLRITLASWRLQPDLRTTRRSSRSCPRWSSYVWLTDAAFLLRLRTLLTTGAILAAGLLPYLFIVIRSNQPGAYLESKATSIAQLPDVIFARQFRDRVFAFDWLTVVTDRLPALVMGVLASELTLPGLALAIAGAAVLASTTARGRAAAVGWRCGRLWSFALNYSVVDTPVFLIPVLLVLWLLAAVGAERLAGLARERVAASHAIVLALAAAAGLAARAQLRGQRPQPRHGRVGVSSTGCSRRCRRGRRWCTKTSSSIDW